MKAKSIIGFLLFLLAFGFGATSCEDMLTPDMTNASDADRRIEDTVFNYLGIMRSMQQVGTAGGFWSIFRWARTVLWRLSRWRTACS